jgi:hypothetical protein
MADVPQGGSHIGSLGKRALVVIFWMLVAAVAIGLTVVACSPGVASNVVNSL